ncbi:Ail/Lom family outer membrane beta-barrel protein [Salmonella enterica subsp. enterica serovar Bredeney]|nr:Ail/Lom family outer membrane beta-barrel protein [Salmonella enterica subsp. enterica serovar Bredeney]EHS1318694.1 Ail/Lom family outer membrane beta-barrel protein [Salmonella enterica subsp. enterica serovar Reading]MJU56755.1 hypothetical protein [Salmonella enterica subsp. enterica serovar Montevideo]
MPEVTTFREAFANYTALLSVSDRLCSGMTGPVWQMNRYVSLYALAGFAYAKMSAFAGE